MITVPPYKSLRFSFFFGNFESKFSTAKNTTKLENHPYGFRKYYRNNLEVGTVHFVPKIFEPFQAFDSKK